MTLRTYHHPVPTILMLPKDILWVTAYAHQALKEAEKRGKEIKNPRSKVEFLKAQKLCALGFARHFGLLDMWRVNHQRVSLYPPDFDFLVAGHGIRILGVPAKEGRSFGANLTARLWEKDYERGHDLYVLACWYPPYVDLVGWIPREELKPFKGGWFYQLEESIVRPIETIPGLKRAL